MSAAFTEDLTGRKFTNLLVVRRGLSKTGRISQMYWICVCDCGSQKEVKVTTDRLLSGRVKSCGCRRKAGDGPRKHGMAGTPTFTAWTRMHGRCGNPNNAKWPRYGGRGITVDPRWDTFENFFADMGEKPHGKSLDRKNNDLGYSKDNCRWATSKEQGRNKGNHRMVIVNGVTKMAIEWAEEYGIYLSTFTTRMDKLGMTPEEALATPFQKAKPRKAYVPMAERRARGES